jgi:hypothetical protein
MGGDEKNTGPLEPPWGCTDPARLYSLGGDREDREVEGAGVRGVK